MSKSNPVSRPCKKNQIHLYVNSIITSRQYLASAVVPIQACIIELEFEPNK